MKGRELRPAVFLDRDGTLVRDPGFLRTPDQVELLPGAAGALHRLGEAGFALVVVTNQSGVARGFLDEPALERIHERLRTLLAAEGARVDGVFYCPHHPTEGKPPYRTACECRKPAPGLLLRAAKDLGLDLERSYGMGDRDRDVEAAVAAGARGISLGFEHPFAAVAASNLAAAAAWILRQGR